MKKRSLEVTVPYLRALGERWDKPYLDITQAELMAWVVELRERGMTGVRGLSDSTISIVLSRVRTLLRWLNDGENPPSLKGVVIQKPGSRVKTKGELPTEEEMEKLLAACSPRYRTIFSLLWRVGARPSEILGLRRDHITFGRDEQGEYAELAFPDTKTDKPRSVPIVDPRVLRLLRRYLKDEAPETGFIFPSLKKSGRHLHPNALYTYMNRAATRAGLKKKFYPYLLRHTRATELRDISPGVRNRLMGWRSPAMWANYEHLATDDLRAALWDRAEAQMPTSEFERMVEEKVQDATRAFERQWRKLIRDAMKGKNPQAVRILMEAASEE